ncbi:hypothetical protein Naga_100718g1 [Nannochloropsis gaditana]|uniref:Ubiquitin-like domain-containing protein n=1 Tax=Nannochloropsis gaditana TaxID=72520 RepID=W7UAR9_9STRA|nr:hypothetical protein Naga_100718g1 [Nannochloropsis gaditana]
MLVTDSTSGEASWPPQRRNTVSPSISPRKHITLTSLFVFGLLSCLVLLPVEAIKRASTPAGNKASRPSPSPPNPKTRPTDDEKSPSPHPPLRQAKRRDTCENHSHGEALTIHLLLSDGQDRVLSLPPATTPQTLRHHLLAQGLVASHQADGLRVRRQKPGGRPFTKGLATLTGLQEGDTILLPPSSSPSSPPSSSSSSFVPYPDCIRLSARTPLSWPGSLSIPPP